MGEKQHLRQAGNDPVERKSDSSEDSLSSLRVERPPLTEGRDSSKSAGLAGLPTQVGTDMERSEQFVLKELDRFKKLMPGEADPQSVPSLESQEQVDARFASIKWKDYDQHRKAMRDRTDAQKQHLSEFDRSMLDLLHQQILLMNYPTVNLLGEGLTKNAGKYRDLLQTFNKDLQVIGQRCQLKDGHFSIEKT